MKQLKQLSLFVENRPGALSEVCRVLKNAGVNIYAMSVADTSEFGILRLLLDNKSNKEISAAICVSENTVKFHVRNLLQKTDCKNRVELKAAYHNMESASLFA